MRYVRKETYEFTFPKEYKSYLDFKEQLKEAGIRFVEEGGNLHGSIIIRTNGRFEKFQDVWEVKEG